MADATRKTRRYPFTRRIKPATFAQICALLGLQIKGPLSIYRYKRRWWIGCEKGGLQIPKQNRK